MKPIVYIFGNGLVGSRLHKELQKRDEIEVVSDTQTPRGHKIYSSPAAIDIKRIIDDLTIVYGAPTMLVNTIGVVGKPNVDWCEDNKHATQYGNVDIAVDMGWVASALEIPYLHVSTGCIFNDTDGKVFYPDDTPNFVESFYSFTKAQAEYQLRLIHKEHQKSRFEIHRIRMPFFPESDPRNLIDKLIKYEQIVDCQNSMTNLDEYVEFAAERVVATTEAPDDENGWYRILHAVNDGSISPAEIVKMMPIDREEKTLITARELNAMCATPRSNCVLGDAELSDVRESMKSVINKYFNQQLHHE